MHWPGRPPSVDILQGTPQAWLRLGREDALRFCRTLPVAVVYINLGHRVSAWLSPESPFYLASGPYDYANLKYFLFGGSREKGAGGGGGGGRKGNQAPPTEAEAAMPAEESEFLEEPAEPELPSATLAKHPALPSRPGLPKQPTLVQPPKTPAAELPGLQGAAELPGIPDPEKLPIEIRLVDSRGNPMADAEYALLLPDRSRKRGKADASGFIRLPDNILPGEVELVLEGLA